MPGTRTTAAVLLGTCVLASSVAASAGLDEPARSAVFLLEKSIQIHQDGTHNELLLALRHLRDPLLEPLFDRLAMSDHPALRIHGILALAEISTEGTLDLDRLAELAEPSAQGELIGIALDDDLVTDDQAQIILNWLAIDTGVKLVVATRLLGRGQFDDPALLLPALEEKKLGRRAMAALLLHQMGEPAGTAELERIHHIEDDQRDLVRAMLLKTATSHGLDAAASWAYRVAHEPGVEPILGLLALRTAMQLGDHRAANLWLERYASATELTQRLRLALVALEHASAQTVDLFDILAGADDPVLRQIGLTGQAIAHEQPDLGESAVALARVGPAAAQRWALSFARNKAPPRHAHRILMALILIADDQSADGPIPASSLNLAALASQSLFEMDPAAAAELLRPVLAASDTDPNVAQAILLGLVRTQHGDALRAIAELGPFNAPQTRALALLLRAKHDRALSQEQRADLGRIVRGSGSLQDTLRMQAAWCYLKHTDQVGLALVKVLAHRQEQ